MDKTDEMISNGEKTTHDRNLGERWAKGPTEQRIGKNVKEVESEGEKRGNHEKHVNQKLIATNS